ncbi:2198_t:CDS:2 [Diversispora eburnea]|uniref:2198_t:CDS:1 n=1 Tax=Diversispora eburnea TaxID=1213867 RepID=A0A9N8YLX4_9GLOM|nr:2198_t:CDS:2 [Diversispora eburnea]
MGKKDKKDKKGKNEQRDQQNIHTHDYENSNQMFINVETNQKGGKSKKDHTESKQPIPILLPPENSTPADNAEINVGTAPANQRTPEKNGTKDRRRRRRPKKAGIFKRAFSLLTFRNLFALYVFLVLFVCHGKTREQCSQWPLEGLCFNGISQYILTHDLFKYIEPGVTEIKSLSSKYGNQVLNTVSVQYETHAKAYVDPLLKAAEPHVQTVKELSIEYVYSPALVGIEKTQEFYDQHAKEHVENYYGKAKEYATPILIQSQEHSNNIYVIMTDYNKNKIKPWYHKNFIPFVEDKKEKLIDYYHTKVIPFTEKAKEFVIEKSKESARQAKEEAERKRKKMKEDERKAKEEAIRKKEETERKAKEEARLKKEEAERKAKLEAERKAKLEAERKAKLEAERKAKLEAERKAKLEAERKAKEETERKAKLEAERKIKEEAESKEAERKATEEAIRATSVTELSRFTDNISVLLKEFDSKAKIFIQNTLDDIEIKIDFIKKSGVDHISKLEILVKDYSREKDTIERVKEFTKQSINNIKGITRESNTRADDLIPILNKKIEELKRETEETFEKRLNEVESIIFSKRGDSNIGQELFTDIESSVTSISESLDEEYKNYQATITNEIVKIEEKKNLIKKTGKDVGRDIIQKQNLLIKNLSTKNKVTEQKSGQEPETPKIIDSTKKDDNVIKSSSDPVLEHLKKGYDPVLIKLNREYNEKIKGKPIVVEGEREVKI